MAALLASALAGLLAAAALGGRVLLALGVGVVQVLLLAGMVRATDVPARLTSALVALAAGLAAAGFVVARDGVAADEGADTLTPLIVAAGLGFVAMVVVQLTRRDGRDRLTASLTLGVTALLLVVSSTAWLGVGDDDAGTAVLLLALAGTATGAAFAAFPGSLLLWAIGGGIAAASVGVLLQAHAATVADTDVGAGAAALAAGACGAAAVAGVWILSLVRRDRALDGADVSGAPDALLVSTLPLVVAAPAAFAVAWGVAEGALV